MQHEADQFKTGVILNTVILCSVFVMFGIGVISFAWLELYQLALENQKLKIDLSLMKEKYALERQQMEEENSHLQLENQMLKDENATLWLERNRLEDLIFQLQSELSLAQRNCANLEVNYKRATTERKQLPLNLTSCQSDKTDMAYEKTQLHLQLKEAAANNSELRKELEEERFDTKTIRKISDERLKKHALAEENRLLKVNLTFAQNINLNLSALSDVLQSNIVDCWAEKQQCSDENFILESRLNKTLSNNTELIRELTEKRLLRLNLVEEQQSLVNMYQLLQSNLSLAQNISRVLHAEHTMYMSSIMSCRAAIQKAEEQSRILNMELNETHAKYISISQTLELNKKQNEEPSLSEAKTTLLANFNTCMTADQQKKEENRDVQSELTEAQTYNTRLRNEYANESLASETLSKERQYLKSNITLHQRICDTLSAGNLLLRENLTSCEANKQSKKLENHNLELELNNSRTKNTLLTRLFAKESLLTKTLNTKKLTLMTSKQHLLLNISRLQGEYANMSAELGILLFNLTSCHSDLQDDKMENKQMNITEVQEKNTLLKKQLADEVLQSKTLLEKAHLLQANITLFEALIANTSAEKTSLHNSLISCQDNKKKAEEEKRNLQVKLNDTNRNNTLLEKQLVDETSMIEVLSVERKSLEDKNLVLQSNLSAAEYTKKSLLEEQHLYQSNLSVCNADKEEQEALKEKIQYTIEKISVWVGDAPAREKEALEKVRTENRDIKTKVSDYEKLAAQYNALQSNVLSCMESSKNIEEDIEKLKVYKEDLHRNLTSCQDDLEQTEKENVLFTLTLKDKRNNMNVLEQDLAKEKLKRDPLIAEIQKLTNDKSLAILKEKLATTNDLQSSVTHCQEESIKLLAENQDVNTKVDQLKSNITSVNNTVQLLEKEIVILNKDIASSLSILASEDTKHKKTRSIFLSPTLKIDRYCDVDTVRCSNCLEGWQEHDSRCFAVSTQVLTFIGARADCIAKGGDMAIVKNEKDQRFLINLLEKSRDLIPEGAAPSAWIGLDDMTEEGQFTWVNDRRGSTYYWSPGSPDNVMEHFDVIDLSEGLEHMQGQDCVVMVLNATVGDSLYIWDDISCRNERHFVCEVDILAVDRTLVPLKV